MAKWLDVISYICMFVMSKAVLMEVIYAILSETTISDYQRLKQQITNAPRAPC